MSNLFCYFLLALRLSTRKSEINRQSPNMRFLIVYFLVEISFLDTVFGKFSQCNLNIFLLSSPLWKSFLRPLFSISIWTKLFLADWFIFIIDNAIFRGEFGINFLWTCLFSLATRFSYYIPNPYLTKQLLTFNILRLLLKNGKIQTPDWSIRLLTFLYAYDNDDKKNHKNNNANNNGKTVDEDDDNNDTELTTIKIIVMIKFLTR